MLSCRTDPAASGIHGRSTGFRDPNDGSGLTRPLGCHCPEERLADQVRGDPIAQCISDDFSREEVFMGSQIEPAFFCGHIGHVADPDLVRPRCLKLLIQQILRHGKGMLRIRRGLELSLLLAPYPQLLPDPSDPADPYLTPCAASSCCNLSGPQVSRVLLWAAFISTSSLPSS